MDGRGLGRGVGEKRTRKRGGWEKDQEEGWVGRGLGRGWVGRGLGREVGETRTTERYGWKRIRKRGG